MTPSPTSSATRTALRCLVHPATLASVVLLIVNDHLLKASHPGWLTGKLSDFAGLFFFPFLLALTISPIARAVRVPSVRNSSARRIGAISFGVTALWFAAAKGTTLGNALTIEAISRLLGHHVSIMLDPGDLIALAMLWPAWLLWRKMAGNPERSLSIRTAIPAVILASIAVMATPPVQVQRLTIAEAYDLHIEQGILYARVGFDGPPLVFETSDNGRTWRRILPPRADSISARADSIPRNWSIDHPHNPLELYKQENGAILSTTDGGRTWMATPIDSLRQRPRVKWTSSDVWDMMFTPDSSGTLVLAIGEGVMVRDSIGRWSQHPVIETP